MNSIVCNHCKKENKNGEQFCNNCGLALDRVDISSQLPIIFIKPSFFRLGDIERNITIEFELDITNTGKGVLIGNIALPASFPGLSSNLNSFKGNQKVKFSLDTSQLKQGENYSDNIVIHSSGGNEYIPVSFKVKGEGEEKLQPFSPSKDKWKTKIVDISPEPIQEKVEISSLSQKRKYSPLAIKLIILAIILIPCIFITIKYFHNNYLENVEKNNYLKILGNCLICFVSEEEKRPNKSNYDIFSVNPDGTGLKNLTANLSRDSHPAFSPVDNKIAFSTNRNGLNKIYIMEIDGKNPRQLTREAVDATWPAWSPDGKHLAFQCFHNNNYEIFRIKSDGSRVLNLTGHEAGDFAPSWSPDGEFIAFESKRDKNKDNTGVITREIYIMRTDGSRKVRITNNNHDDFTPSWSRDSKKLAFISNEDNLFNIYTVNIDGTELFRVTSQPGIKSNPHWTGDGNHIIYSYYSDFFINRLFHKKPEWEIFMIKSDGKNPLRLIKNGGKELDIKFL